MNKKYKRIETDENTTIEENLSEGKSLKSNLLQTFTKLHVSHEDKLLMQYIQKPHNTSCPTNIYIAFKDEVYLKKSDLGKKQTQLDNILSINKISLTKENSCIIFINEEAKTVTFIKRKDRGFFKDPIYSATILENGEIKTMSNSKEAHNLFKQNIAILNKTKPNSTQASPESRALTEPENNLNFEIINLSFDFEEQVNNSKSEKYILKTEKINQKKAWSHDDFKK